MGKGGFLWVDQNVLGLHNGGICITLWILQKPLKCTLLKKGIFQNKWIIYQLQICYNKMKSRSGSWCAWQTWRWERDRKLVIMPSFYKDTIFCLPDMNHSWLMPKVGFIHPGVNIWVKYIHILMITLNMTQNHYKTQLIVFVVMANTRIQK